MAVWQPAVAHHTLYRDAPSLQFPTQRVSDLTHAVWVINIRSNLGTSAWFLAAVSRVAQAEVVETARVIEWCWVVENQRKQKLNHFLMSGVSSFKP